MTKITNTYISKSGDKYDLLEFDNTRLYSPAEVRSVKASQQIYYNAITTDKQRAAREAEEAKKSKQLTEDEYFKLAKAKDDAMKAEQKALEDKYKAQADEKAAFLRTSPDTVKICESNLHSFLLMVQHWASKKYTFSEPTLESIAPNFYAVEMNKVAK
jgi:hypothetical protein